MKNYYNQNYSKEEIRELLEEIKNHIRDNNYNIVLNKNRQENINFMQEYNINSNKQKQILLDIDIFDFCHSLNNKNKGYEYEILYVFAPVVSLVNVEGI